MNTDNSMSGRINVVLPDEVYEIVKDLAELERRSQSQMSAILIEEALKARKLLDEQSATPSTGKGSKSG